jgi:hypothetical protein
MASINIRNCKDRQPSASRNVRKTNVSVEGERGTIIRTNHNTLAQNSTSKARTLLSHVGCAGVEDAHRPGEFGAGQRGRAGYRDAAEDLGTKRAARAGALHDHLQELSAGDVRYRHSQNVVRNSGNKQLDGNSFMFV